MRSLIVLTAAAVAAATLTATASATTGATTAETRSAWQTTTATHLRHSIAWHRRMTWRNQDRAGVSRTPSRYMERRSWSIPFLRWDNRRWKHRQYAARVYATTHPRYVRYVNGYGGTGWDRVAACESGGNWSLVTGNGFYWGLQWVPSTWDSRANALGLPTFRWFMAHHTAPSREMQIRAATGMSLSNWPVCGARY